METQENQKKFNISKMSSPTLIFIKLDTTKKRFNVVTHTQEKQRNKRGTKIKLYKIHN